MKTFLNGFFDNNDTDKDGKLLALAGPDSAPKLMPAIVTGMSSLIGSRAKRVPITTSVAQRSR